MDLRVRAARIAAVASVSSKPGSKREVLVAGGDADPNLAALVTTLSKRGDRFRTLYVGPGTHPRITWDFESDELAIDGVAHRPEALFIRHDVFSALADPRPAPAHRALTWYSTIAGWAVAHPGVRMFNSASALELTNKLHVLRIARELGVPTPRTVVTNDRQRLDAMLAREAWITKPVNGGDFARRLAAVLEHAEDREGALASPAIVQEQLIPPEVRVYSIGGRFFAFQLIADALDYRSTADCKIVPLELESISHSLLDGLERLMSRLKMDFGAADFKASPDTGELKFLEINNGPMFAGFDHSCGGALTNAMAEFLTTP
jgi:glutathione synthase/RimK-type ligase-like ATP-grasp enzyme